MSQENGWHKVSITETLDYRIGFSSGKELAMQDASLTPEQVTTEGHEHFDHSTISIVLNEKYFVAGFNAGYALYLEGIV